ncbi:MAG: DUF4976 domain-containing protein, partial [Pirellulaceae bacterium]|nr:DUF4976 domain-containing protein [Pirellulaceae bacterium]
STLDVLPTICDYAGVAGPAVMRGESLREVIDKPETAGHEFVVSEMAGGGTGGLGRSFMVRTKQHKYMMFPAAPQTEMLFDLQADPGEMKNLAGQATLAAELERHRRLLAQWNRATDEDKHPVQPSPKAAKLKAGRKPQPAGKAKRGLSVPESARKQ